VAVECVLSDPGGEDLKTLVRGVELAAQVMRAPALAPYARLLDADEPVEARIRHRGFTIYHPTSTCRMGTDDLAVVDPEMRVRGIDGLRVADASVMPRIIRGHTHAPALLIGGPAADSLRGRARSSRPPRSRAAERASIATR
jgi:choline dehydrogenase